jgi:hypothetical protein
MSDAREEVVAMSVLATVGAALVGAAKLASNAPVAEARTSLLEFISLLLGENPAPE